MSAEAGPADPSGEPALPDGDPTPVDPEVQAAVPRSPATPAWLGAARSPRLAPPSVELAAVEPAPDLPSRWAAWAPARWRGARFAIGGRGLVVLALLGLVVAAIAGVGVARDQPASVPVPELPEVPQPVATGLTTDLGEPGEPGEISGPAAVPEEIVVSVQGLVGMSGLVRLDTGARVADAIEAAGGALDGADLHSLNLAQRLADGDQVLVGIASTDGGPPQLGSATLSGAGGSAAPGASTGAIPAGGVVNLNTATVGELETLPGVGPVTAQSIVDWRSANGRFTSVDELADVRGIGPARLASLRELVTL